MLSVLIIFVEHISPDGLPLYIPPTSRDKAMSSSYTETLRLARFVLELFAGNGLHNNLIYPNAMLRNCEKISDFIKVKFIYLLHFKQQSLKKSNFLNSTTLISILYFL